MVMLLAYNLLAKEKFLMQYKKIFRHLKFTTDSEIHEIDVKLLFKSKEFIKVL